MQLDFLSSYSTREFGTELMSFAQIFRILAVAGGLALSSITPNISLAQGLEELSFPKKLKLAKVGDEDAQMAVAKHYEAGSKVKRSRLEAAKWYRMAMEQGNVDAQYRLARLVHQGGDGLKQDLIMAAQLYQEAAELGNIEAQNWLGYCFQHGIGVAANDQSSFEWYRRAADAGLASAQNNLGLMYLTGRGTERSLLRAHEFFEKSAAQGDNWGLNNLGGMYEMGWSVAKDPRRALELYGKAVEAGNKPAQDNFARLSAIVEGRPPPRAVSTETTQVKPAAAPAAAARQSPGVTVFTPDAETQVQEQ
jgi:TPR repeat protein